MSDAPKKRGGSKKGREFVKIKRAEGDELRRHDIWLLDSDWIYLTAIGDGNAARGVRKMIAALRSLMPPA